MNLVYVSYQELAEPPQWLNRLRQEDTGDLSFLDPNHSIVEQVQDEKVLARLSKPAHYKASEHKAVLRLEEALFQDLESMMPRIGLAETTPYLDVCFKNLYCLLRSDLVLVDMNDPGPAHEVLYAWMLEIPVLGVTHRFVNSPSIQSKCSATVTPTTVGNITDLANLLISRTKHEGSTDNAEGT